MKRLLVLFVVLFSSLLLIAGCSSETSTTNSKNEDADLSEVGNWQTYSDDVTEDEYGNYSIDLDLQDDGSFELSYSGNIGAEEDGSPIEAIAEVSGDYTVDDNELVLKVSKVKDDDKVLATDVKEDSEITLTFTMTEDYDELTIENMNDVITNVDATAIFDRI